MYPHSIVLTEVEILFYDFRGGDGAGDDCGCGIGHVVERIVIEAVYKSLIVDIGRKARLVNV